jgi:hypothetical protein
VVYITHLTRENIMSKKMFEFLKSKAMHYMIVIQVPDRVYNVTFTASDLYEE